MLVFSAERPQGAPSLADRHAAIRPAALLPQPQDPRTELAHPRRKATSDPRTENAGFLPPTCSCVTCLCVCVCQNCTFGYHAGGWGKPPVDEMGKPLYGDVFGTNAIDFQVRADLTLGWRSEDTLSTVLLLCCNPFHTWYGIQIHSRSGRIENVKIYIFFPLDFPFSLASF